MSKTQTKKRIGERLAGIQAELKAPKNQYNKFGNYPFRSCEDILEGVKPLLKKYDLFLLLDDEMIHLGDRYYVKATATVRTTEGENSIGVSAPAREVESRKGMDASQITGSASSYARKYALNGLFAIDDTKDADTKAPKENNGTAEKPADMTPKRKSTNNKANRTNKKEESNGNGEKAKVLKRLKELKKELGEEDFYFILKKGGVKNPSDLTISKAKQLIPQMEQIANVGSEMEGELVK